MFTSPVVYIVWLTLVNLGSLVVLPLLEFELLFEFDVDFAFTVIETDLLILSGVVAEASVTSPEIDTL